MDKKNQGASVVEELQEASKPKAEYKITANKEGIAEITMKVSSLKQAKAFRTGLTDNGFTVKIYMTKEIQ